MSLRPCLDCGQLSEGPRCSEHRKARERVRSAARAPFRRGRYGREHKELRAWWAPRVATGKVKCRRREKCLRWPNILIGQEEPWDLGHPDSECSYPVAPEHELCNRSAAGRGHA